MSCQQIKTRSGILCFLVPCLVPCPEIWDSTRLVVEEGGGHLSFCSEDRQARTGPIFVGRIWLLFHHLLCCSFIGHCLQGCVPACHDFCELLVPLTCQFAVILNLVCAHPIGATAFCQQFQVGTQEQACNKCCDLAWSGQTGDTRAAWKCRSLNGGNGQGWQWPGTAKLGEMLESVTFKF